MIFPLLIGAALLLASVLSYAIAMSLVVRVVARLIQAGYTGPGFWKNLIGISLVMLITATAHLTQIALWGVALLLCGPISGFEKAFYFSAQNYTALGYGDVLLSDRWRLLGPLEAINGLLFFGLSTALLFAIISRLIANRLHVEIGHPNEAVVDQELLPVDASGTGAEDSLSRTRLAAAEDKP
jgi:Ion channel